MTQHTIASAVHTTWKTNASSTTWTLEEQGSITLAGTAILNQQDFSRNTFVVLGDINAKSSKGIGLDISGARNLIQVGETSRITADLGVITGEVGQTIIRNAGTVACDYTAIHTRSDAILYNSGTLSASDAVWFGDKGSIVNRTGGQIVGVYHAITADGHNVTIENQGVISSQIDAAIEGDGGMKLLNSGMIDGDVYFGSGLEANVFDSRGGVVHGNVSGGNGRNTFYLDKGDVDGKIYSGGDLNIYHLTSRDIDIVATNGEDRIFSTVSYTLGSWMDQLRLQGDGNLYGTGNSRNNYIEGNAGNNHLSGRNGNDILRGGIGRDILTGDMGADRFDFSGEIRKSGDFDVIKDFEHGVDKIYLLSNLVALDHKYDGFNTSRIEQHGNDTWIDYGILGHLVLKGISAENELDMNDFILQMPVD